MMEQKARIRILKAARSEFFEKGYDGTRMAMISKKAGVNQAMLHYYYNTKENLYEQVLLGLFGFEQKPLVLDLINKNNLNPPQNLYAIMYYLVNFHLNQKNPAIERFLYSQIGKGGIAHLMRISKKFMHPQFQFLVNALKLGTESGEFECIDILLTAMQIQVFIVSYEHFRLRFSDTEVHGHYYGKGYKDQVFDFLIKQTFKLLTPAGGNIAIPSIPVKLIKELDKAIELIIKKMQGVS
jgi:TetR/AcrR family transcriptional regulator